MSLTRYIPWLITLISIGVVWYAHQAGYQQGVIHESAICDRAAAEMLIDQERGIREQLQGQIDQADEAVRKLRTEKRAIEAHAEVLKQEIEHVTKTYRHRPDAEPQPLPECIFTRGFVGVYNQSITARGAADLSEAGAAARADGETGSASTAGADPLAPSEIGQRDILRHIGKYGGRCLAIESQLNTLIDYLQQQQAGTP